MALCIIKRPPISRGSRNTASGIHAEGVSAFAVNSVMLGRIGRLARVVLFMVFMKGCLQFVQLVGGEYCPEL